MAWYKDWFNSKYYHLLYKNRDHNEAALFLDNISNEFKNKNAKILDVACGKGRHAKYLNNLGFDVTGIDLSVNSIKYAKEYENQKLKFHQHDMRNIFDENNFDIDRLSKMAMADPSTSGNPKQLTEADMKLMYQHSMRGELFK